MTEQSGYVDKAQWFDAVGTCRCGKKATGILRGVRNESYGPYCERCAETRIKKALEARNTESRRRCISGE